MERQDTPFNAERDDPSTAAKTGVNEHDTRSQDPRGLHADEYPAYLRLVRDLPAATPFNLGEDKLHHMPSGNKDSGWQNCLDSVEKYDRELCQAYREQIDTLLVFAGLFSAVVTAFAVESYQWLQDDPIDTSVELLRDVVALMSQNANLTAPPFPSAVQQLSGAAIVRINSFWFLSLTLSLSAALVGILCKQWLREFERNVGQSPETALGVRHIRFQGLEYWKVGSIITSVPIIMQMALAFFLIGIVELLWRLHTVVACCVTVTAGLMLAFYLATTFLPAVQYAYICLRCYVKPLRTWEYAYVQAFTQPQCAFKSAQAWLTLRVAKPVIDRILKSHGYHFSSPSQVPDRISDYILRPTESWVAFDLNWVKCRENVHVGPRCAFESLRWIAGNLEELHMSSWIWHCVWARWLKNRDSPDDLVDAAREIDSVSRSYPRMVILGNNHTMLARSQALIFRCSLRSDIPVDTTLELLLRVAAVSGASSQWTQEALRAVRVTHREQSIRLSDDISLGLFRLAKAQMFAILYTEDRPDSSARTNATYAFRDLAAILRGGTHFRDTFMPALCGLVLQWLRSRPPPLIAHVARLVFEDMVRYLVTQGYRGSGLQNLREHRGIMFIAKLAQEVMLLWPDEARIQEKYPDDLAVFLELLNICSYGFPELMQDILDARSGMPMEPVVGADGDGSNAPAPDDRDAPAGEETHVDPPERVTHLRKTSQPAPHVHLHIDECVEASTDAAPAEVGVNGAASPVAKPVAPSSPPRSPVSPDLSTTPFG